MDVPHAWMAIFGAMGLILMALSLYHARVLPSGARAEPVRSGSMREMAATFWDVVVSFLKKPNIYLLLLFILLYRAGEGQVVTDWAAVPGGQARGGRPGAHHGPVRHDLRHCGDGGVHRGQRSGRVLHLVAGPAARAAAADLRHELSQPGLRVFEHGPAEQPPAGSPRR